LPKLPPLQELINALLNMDENIVTEELLIGLRGIIPTQEEMNLIRKANENRGIVELEKPEKFLLELAELSLLSERIEPWIFKFEYRELSENIEEPLRILDEAIKQVRKSGNLRAVLTVIRAFGNRMNETNRQRNQADGFMLDILSKLVLLKDTSGAGTLLDFVVKICLENFKTIYRLKEELDLIEVAAKINILAVESDINLLKERFEVAIFMSEAVSKDPRPGKYLQVMEPFLNNAKVIVEDFETRFKILNQEFNDLLNFLCYAPAQIENTTFEEFFSMLNEFIVSFEESRNKQTEKKKDPNTTGGPRGKIGEGENPLQALAIKIKEGGVTMDLNVN